MRPGDRITADEALRDGWLAGAEERPLDAVRANLRSLRASARLRRAMHAATVKTRSVPHPPGQARPAGQQPLLASLYEYPGPARGPVPPTPPLPHPPTLTPRTEAA
jgi:hypothetical protein